MVGGERREAGAEGALAGRDSGTTNESSGPFRGEIWWIASTTESGRRPVVVVQNDVGNTRARTVIVAAVSAGRPQKRYPQTVPLDDAVLGRPATVRTDVLQTITKSRLLERAAVLPPEMVEQLDEALRRSLALR